MTDIIATLRQLSDIWENYQIGLRAAEAADHIEELESRMKLALKLRHSNYSGFVDWALQGRKIPQDVLDWTEEYCDETEYDPILE